MLSDSYGRVATDLRVSLTDRCNLRCTYCMPPEGLDWLPAPELLTDDEVVRLIRIGVTLLGIREVRFTGGEPLLRRGLPGIVAATAALDPRPRIALTTNGIGLARLAPALAEAGLDRVNVSLDTVDADTFEKLTRRRRLDDVLAGLAAAARRRTHPGQGQRGPDARHQRPRGTRPARLLPGTRLPAAVHRADAARRPARLAARPTWSPPTRSWTGSASAYTLTPADAAAARQRPRRTVPGRRRPGHRRRHRLGDPPVLRSLRPGAAHRGRPGPQLPVRPRRVRPARPAARGRERRPNSPNDGGPPSPRNCPATASTTPVSCSRAAPCPRSAADHSAQTPAHPGRGAHATEKRPRGLPSREDRGERLPNGPCPPAQGGATTPAPDQWVPGPRS